MKTSAVYLITCVASIAAHYGLSKAAVSYIVVKYREVFCAS